MPASESITAPPGNGPDADADPHGSLTRQSRLTVSADELSFTQTAADKPAFLILTISQQEDAEPVTLTTNAGAYFQFASDKRPAFLPSLTLTPDAAGTYVHVRYFSSKPAVQRGELIVRSSLEEKRVALVGSHSRLLPGFRTHRPTDRKASKGTTIRKGLLSRQALILLLTVTVLTGIAYATFIYRSRYAPTLTRIDVKQSQNDARGKQLTSTAANGVRPTETSKRKASTGKRVPDNDAHSAIEEPPVGPSAATPSVAASLDKTPVSPASEESEPVATVEKRAEPKKTVRSNPDEQLAKKYVQRAPEEPRAAVRDTTTSELERILNRPR